MGNMTFIIRRRGEQEINGKQDRYSWEKGEQELNGKQDRYSWEKRGAGNK